MGKASVYVGNYVGFWMRFLAALIDGIILTIAAGVIFWALGLNNKPANLVPVSPAGYGSGSYSTAQYGSPTQVPYGSSPSRSNSPWQPKPNNDPAKQAMKARQAMTAMMAMIMKQLMVVVPLGLLYEVLLTGLIGGTLGKRLLGMRVVLSDGQPIGIGGSFLRYIVKWVAAAVTCYLAFLVVAFHPDKRGVHDLAAGCAVVSDNA